MIYYCRAIIKVLKVSVLFKLQLLKWFCNMPRFEAVTKSPDHNETWTISRASVMCTNAEHPPHLAGWQRSPYVGLQGTGAASWLCHQPVRHLSSTCPSRSPSHCCLSDRWRSRSESRRLLPIGRRETGSADAWWIRHMLRHIQGLEMHYVYIKQCTKVR